MRRYSMPSVAVYDFATGLVFGRRYDEIARAIAAEAPNGGTVVDLGSGPGEVLVRLASLAPSLHLTGVDIDAGMVARAQRKAERRVSRGQAQLRFVVADAAALPIADESVDLVVSSYAVHHFPDRHAARAEIMRVLKPGGRAIIWDVASPHGAPAPTDGSPGHGAAHGHGAPAAHPAGALGMIRMLIRFGRIPAERYELRKA
jgi:ubiquinone/menaquinone biosynthesis C-methylase UbiE